MATDIVPSEVNRPSGIDPYAGMKYGIPYEDIKWKVPNWTYEQLATTDDLDFLRAILRKNPTLTWRNVNPALISDAFADLWYPKCTMSEVLRIKESYRYLMDAGLYHGVLQAERPDTPRLYRWLSMTRSKKGQYDDYYYPEVPFRDGWSGALQRFMQRPTDYSKVVKYYDPTPEEQQRLANQVASNNKTMSQAIRPNTLSGPSAAPKEVDEIAARVFLDNPPPRDHPYYWDAIHEAAVKNKDRLWASYPRLDTEKWEREEAERNARILEEDDYGNIKKRKKPRKPKTPSKKQRSLSTEEAPPTVPRPIKPKLSKNTLSEATPSKKQTIVTPSKVTPSKTTPPKKLTTATPSKKQTPATPSTTAPSKKRTRGLKKDLDEDADDDKTPKKKKKKKTSVTPSAKRTGVKKEDVRVKEEDTDVKMEDLDSKKEVTVKKEDTPIKKEDTNDDDDSDDTLAPEQSPASNIVRRKGLRE